MQATPPDRRLVLLPGMDGSGQLFAPFIAALTPGLEAQVIAYPPQQAWGYEELFAWVLKALPQEQPFVVLGESFSGPLAARLARAAHPGLRGAILCCSFVRNPRPLLGALSPLLPLLPLKAAPMGLLAPLLMGGDQSPELCEALKQAMDSVGPAALQARLRAVAALDLRREMAAVTLPLHYLQAASDRVVPPRAWAELSRCMPTATRSVLAGPHFLLQTHPREAAAAVEAFLFRVCLAAEQTNSLKESA